ncbi:MAG: radical SAM protein, partial [Planctomycetota bacterium]
MVKLSSEYGFSPSFLILYVTAACNMNCAHCFNWQSVQRDKQEADLPIEIAEALFANLKLKSVSLTGGEPFIRRDLVDLCGMYARSTPEQKDLYIPTNGYQTDDIVKKVHDICRFNALCPTIGISLDGLQKTHDRIRQRPQAFNKAINTLDGLMAVKKDYPQLIILVNTCVNAENAEEFPELARFLIERVPSLDYHEVDIIRGDPRSSWLRPPDKKQFKNLITNVKQIKKIYLSKNKTRLSRFQRESAIAVQTLSLNYQYQILFNNRYMMSCPILDKYITVFNNGDVAFCELTQPIGNLKEKSITAILDSPAAKQTAQDILKSKCRCYHGCYVPFFIAARPFKVLRGLVMLKNLLFTS